MNRVCPDDRCLKGFIDVFSSLPGPTKTLFVKGLSEDTTDQTLKDAFEGASAARIVTDRETGASKWYVCGPSGCVLLFS